MPIALVSNDVMSLMGSLDGDTGDIKDNLIVICRYKTSYSDYLNKKRKFFDISLILSTLRENTHLESKTTVGPPS